VAPFFAKSDQDLALYTFFFFFFWLQEFVILQNYKKNKIPKQHDQWNFLKFFSKKLSHFEEKKL
jgi:hypothetical protein